MAQTRQYAEGIEFAQPRSRTEVRRHPDAQAVEFVAKLSREFHGGSRRSCRKGRAPGRIDAGEMPDFLPETKDIREGDWKIAPIPDDLQDRRVELTGPPDRKMTINALNSGSATWMADFETSPDVAGNEAQQTCATP